MPRLYSCVMYIRGVPVILATFPGCLIKEKAKYMRAEVGKSLIDTIPYAANDYVRLSAVAAYSLKIFSYCITS